MALRVSDQIEEADELQLIWYFGDLGTRFERSVFGAMLEQVELMGAFSKKCSVCAGTGIVDAGGFGLVLEEAKRSRMVLAETGIGAIPDETKRWEHVERDIARGGWCKPCRGTGALPSKAKGWRGSICEMCDGKRRVPRFEIMREAGVRPMVVEMPTDPCPDCLSTGRRPLSARPMLAPNGSTRGAPDDVILNRFAIISRRLALVNTRRALWFKALQAYYGDVGQRWALEEQGRIFALYNLTPSGRKLARWAEGRSTLGKGSQMQKNKKKKIAWKNPSPAPVAYPFLTLSEVLQDGKDWARQRGRGSRFIGPRFQDGTATASQHRELGAMLGPTRLTEHDHEPPPTDLSPLERIGVEAGLDRKHPNEHRRKLLLAAGAEALDLYQDSARAWNTVARMGERVRAQHSAAVIRLVDEAIKRGKTELAEYIGAQAEAL